MLLDVYLGETLGSRGGGGVTLNAEVGSINFCRRDAGVGRMLRLRSMTCFTVHMRMFAGALGAGDVGVADFARLMPRELSWPCSDLSDRGGPVMPILAECARNNIAANGPEDEKRNNEERRKTEQMSCVFKEVHPAQSSPEQRKADAVGCPMLSRSPNNRTILALKDELYVSEITNWCDVTPSRVMWLQRARDRWSSRDARFELAFRNAAAPDLNCCQQANALIDLVSVVLLANRKVTGCRRLREGTWILRRYALEEDSALTLKGGSRSSFCRT